MSRSACGFRALAVLTPAVASLWLAAGLVLAQAPAKRPDPAVLVGPTRVTLVGGKTIEAIAVFREATRVRVILEDDTEIILDPAKVVSVVALADLPDEPPPRAAPKPSPPGRASKGAARPAVKVHAEPAGNGRPAPSAKGAASSRTSGAPPADGSGAANESVEGGEDATAREKEERRREVEELAGMLQAAIANAALEGPRSGGPDEGPTGEEVGQDVGGGGGVTSAPADDEGAKEKPYKPKPEDFDATQPVNKAGYRFLGPKGKVPETPPQGEFPAPSTPTTSLGFKADVWRPASGFSSGVKWPTPLQAPTSFSNRLSGLDRPITSFGPRWWNPKSTSWGSSTFPQTWQPRDGFAQDQERRAPTKKTPASPPADENK